MNHIRENNRFFEKNSIIKNGVNPNITPKNKFLNNSNNFRFFVLKFIIASNNPNPPNKVPRNAVRKIMGINTYAKKIKGVPSILIKICPQYEKAFANRTGVLSPAR